MLFIVVPPSFCLLLEEQLKAFLPMFLKQTTHVQEMLLRSNLCRCDGPRMLCQVWFHTALMGYVGHRFGSTLLTFGPFYSAIFWHLPHSAPVGIYRRIYSAGFYFNFLFINLHPNLDSFVSLNITKAVVPPCGQMLQTRSVEIALLMQTFCPPRQKNGFCQGKGQPGWKQWIQTWIATNLFYAIQNSNGKYTSS